MTFEFFDFQDDEFENQNDQEGNPLREGSSFGAAATADDELCSDFTLKLEIQMSTQTDRPKSLPSGISQAFASLFVEDQEMLPISIDLADQKD